MASTSEYLVTFTASNVAVTSDPDSLKPEVTLPMGSRPLEGICCLQDVNTLFMVLDV